MICTDFPLLYSAQLDGHATEHDQMALQRHLRECAMCRRSAAEMRSLRADLRALPAPLPDPGMTRQIRIRLRQEASASTAIAGARSVQVARSVIRWPNYEEIRKFWFNSFANWLEGRRAKIFSQGIGAIVSLLLFSVVITEVFSQAHRNLATGANLIDTTTDVLRYQARLKAALIYTPPPPSLLNPIEFRGAVAGLREEDVILTAEIGKDGSAAKIMYVVPPNDPSVEAKLSTAMSQSGTFQGVKPNQNISTVAVVYLSSITTTARL